MSGLLDLVARRSWFLSRLFLGLGIAAAAYYWYYLTEHTGLPVDVAWYWGADPSNLYPHPELLERNGYNYSPAFELVVGWGRLLPFEVFVAIWRAILLAALVWLAGPATIFVLFLSPVASEVNAGNIQLLLATAVVLGLRTRPAWAAAWAFVLLTKVTPGVGLLWLVARRRWRSLAVALGVTGAIAAATFLLWPERWFGWFALMTAGSPPPVSPFYLPFLPRMVVAAAIVALGAWRGWRWPVVVGATIGLPVFYPISLSLLVGVLPFVREALARRLRLRLAGRSA